MNAPAKIPATDRQSRDGSPRAVPRSAARVPPTITLGAAIKQVRSDRKLSLQEVANRAGLTKAHVWDLERGRATNPGVNTLHGLARALDIDPMVLARAAFGWPATTNQEASQ